MFRRKLNKFLTFISWRKCHIWGSILNHFEDSWFVMIFQQRKPLYISLFFVARKMPGYRSFLRPSFSSIHILMQQRCNQAEVSEISIRLNGLSCVWSELWDTNSGGLLRQGWGSGVGEKNNDDDDEKPLSLFSKRGKVLSQQALWMRSKNKNIETI